MKTGRPRKHSESLTLPVYESMTGCAAHSGIPLHILKSAKAAGCVAFKLGGRVDLTILLRWLFSRQESGESHEERKLRAEADLAEIKVAKAREELVEATAVERWAETVFVSLRQGILTSSLSRDEQDILLRNIRRLVATAVGAAEPGDSDDEVVDPAPPATAPDG